MNLINQYLSKSYNTDKGSIHSYIENFYDPTFSPYENDKIKILEIGVRHGGSIELWRDFFKNGEVYGIDNGSENITYPSGCTVILEDAYSQNIFDKLPTSFDFIIDDGPHTLESQPKFIEKYLKLLDSNGIAIIEDIASIENANILQNSIPSKYESKILDLRSYKNRFDDIILWIQNI